MKLPFGLGFLAQVGVAALALGMAGCSTTGVYKHVAKIGISLVGDTIAEDETKKEASQVLGQNAAAADQRYGQPRGVFLDVEAGRQVRIYNVANDLLGGKRWVIEYEGDRARSFSQAEENPNIPDDKAKSLLLETRLKGMTPEQIQNTPVLDKMIFKSRPRNLKRVPTGELVQVYDVTSFTDLTGSRFLVLGFDAAGGCQSVRYVGTPGKGTGG